MANPLIRLLKYLDANGSSCVHDLDTVAAVLREVGAVPAALSLGSRTILVAADTTSDVEAPTIWASRCTPDSEAKIRDCADGWWIAETRGVLGLAIHLEQEPTADDQALLFGIHAALDHAYLDCPVLNDELGVAVVEFDIESERFTYVSPTVEKLFGYPVSRWTDEGAAFSTGLIHPEDVETVMSSSYGAMTSGATADYVFRAICSDESIKWMAARVRVRSTIAGLVTRSTLIDISAAHLETINGATASASSSSSNLEKFHPRRRVVLLVEEEEVVRRAARRVLEEGGFRVYESSSLETLPTQHLALVGLVIADLSLTSGSAQELVDALRETGLTSPIVMLGTPVEASWDGPILSKPFSAPHLLRIAHDLAT